MTPQGLADSLATAMAHQFANNEVTATSVGPEGGQCQGTGARWSCSVAVQLGETTTINDRRSFKVTVNSKGCWRAVQTGTDVGETGRPVRPKHPQRLHGCV